MFLTRSTVIAIYGVEAGREASSKILCCASYEPEVALASMTNGEWRFVF